ncbi:MAG: metal-sensitive transcriptional regulator, partial [Candidatus Bipolaricaulia bacterium]
MHEHSHEQATQRLKKISGHVGAVLRMVEEGRDCPEILLQVSAVRAALTQV